jgi:predicted glycosyltransferase
MKIVQYCQHVLGVGHYFRSLEIARSLHRHEIVLVTGGPPVEVNLPSHVTEYRLPGLQMDGAFAVISPTDANRALHEVKEERKRLLYSLFEKNAPDLFLIELYPFGRKSFGFEILPLLEAVHRGDFSSTKVVCSLRDILVEKKNQKTYEQRVLDILNKYFDGLLVHADETLISLSETFESTDRIKIPLLYTGFITPRPKPDGGKEVRARLGLKRDEALIIASAGGGRVGEDLLRSVVEAYACLTGERRVRLCIFTGPFMAEPHFTVLSDRVASLPGVQLERFTADFLSYLAAADLSISMAGYNTCMNILATGVPSLVFPFSQNREQRIRVEKLAALGGFSLLREEDLEPARLATLIIEVLSSPIKPGRIPVNLDGARETARWLEHLHESASP